MLFLMLLSAPVPTHAGPDAWVPATHSAGFEALRGQVIVPQAAVMTRTLDLALPWGVRADAGGYAEWSTQIRLPAAESVLRFSLRDDYDGPTAGHHFIQMLLGDAVLWERDVAGAAGGVDAVQVRLPAGQPGDARLAFRLACKKLVTNFGVRVSLADVRLTSADGETALLPVEAVTTEYRDWPADLPLPSLPPAEGWTRTASILQPWADTQAMAVLEADQWAPRLAEDFGFSAVIMLPPEAHNAITPDKPITEAQFQHAIAAYRRAGMKVIVYTAIMHCGHAPAWMSGALGREHPEWSMRDPAGGTVTTYGAPWLCPNTGALEYTLQYTEGLLRKYHADGLMLDNNEFINSDAGLPTCYCDGCRRRFREYVVARFGETRLKDLLGLTPDQVRIPESPDAPLWGLWLSWRNRVWAEALETFRQRLRAASPGVAVLANTAYLYASWELATDQQYAHEDAVLSETVGLGPEGTAAKMTLGRALAQGRPLWNYIGTFQVADYSRLREASDVDGIVAASNASGANPWIVFYGFTGDANEAAVGSLTSQMAFWREHAAQLVGGEERADVAVLLSPESRDLAGVSLLPDWLGGLVRSGVSVAGIWEPQAREVTDFAGAQVLVATGAPCMRERTARELAAWVRRGGRLITCPETGWRDELGRWRTQSALAVALGAPVCQPGRRTIGRGTVECVANPDQAPQAVSAAVTPRATGDKPVMVHWRSTPGGSAIALAAVEPGPCQVTLRLPEGVTRATLVQPGHEPQSLGVTDGRAAFELPERIGLVSF